jgi:hypothetical protein
MDSYGIRRDEGEKIMERNRNIEEFHRALIDQDKAAAKSSSSSSSSTTPAAKSTAKAKAGKSKDLEGGIRIIRKSDKDEDDSTDPAAAVRGLDVPKRVPTLRARRLDDLARDHGWVMDRDDGEIPYFADWESNIFHTPEERYDRGDLPLRSTFVKVNCEGTGICWWKIEHRQDWEILTNPNTDVREYVSSRLGHDVLDNPGFKILCVLTRYDTKISDADQEWERCDEYRRRFTDDMEDRAEEDNRKRTSKGNVQSHKLRRSTRRKARRQVFAAPCQPNQDNHRAKIPLSS